ncbi:ExbD/TolR family protein [Marinomonas communis]|jgi:biopolymer transport protein ExbD|uniref:Outer membrane transport energization protein ExbD n=1 Tax=Marinomonas communis TaxID=28254 RepID=A0A4R6X4F4_9GAMM|nr:biopolymer transporter ExbD [Marinomonas communis]TDR06212.1 outer membrane transport energization protein ExbD [Marinomonas communis]
MNINQKFIAQRDSQAGDDGVIPLINVVFLMLIFFMVAGQIQKSDPIKITPPNSINEQRAATEPNVLIVLGTNGELYLNDDLTKVEDVQSRLSVLFDQASDKDEFWVQVKADGDVSIEALRPLFSEIKASGLTKVSVATQLGKGTE